MYKGIFDRRKAVCACSSLVLMATLAGCGGGGGGGSTIPADNPLPPAGGTPPVSGGTPLTAGVGGLVGEWILNGCLAQGAESFKTFIRATQLASNRINFDEGVLTYVGNSCAGAAVQVGPSNMGTVTFSRSESNATLAANWGEFNTITGTKSAVIWAKKSESVLCLFGDSSPSIFPTLTAASSSLSALPDLACFIKK